MSPPPKIFYLVVSTNPKFFSKAKLAPEKDYGLGQGKPNSDIPFTISKSLFNKIF